MHAPCLDSVSFRKEEQESEYCQKTLKCSLTQTKGDSTELEICEGALNFCMYTFQTHKTVTQVVRLRMLSKCHTMERFLFSWNLTKEASPKSILQNQTAFHCCSFLLHRCVYVSDSFHISISLLTIFIISGDIFIILWLHILSNLLPVKLRLQTNILCIGSHESSCL